MGNVVSFEAARAAKAERAKSDQGEFPISEVAHVTLQLVDWEEARHGEFSRDFSAMYLHMLNTGRPHILVDFHVLRYLGQPLEPAHLWDDSCTPDGILSLNLSPLAVRNLVITPEHLEFDCRRRGQDSHLRIPIEAVISIYDIDTIRADGSCLGRNRVYQFTL
jgi:hypothetical protein